MKLLRESPVEFLEPLSRPPEKVFAAEVECDRKSILIAGSERGLLQVRLDIPLPYFIERIESEWNSEVIIDEKPLHSIAESIISYFEGSAEPIKAVVQPIHLTPFTIAVHRAISRIPFGGTFTYGDIAVLLGYPGAARAVGTACGKNSVLLVVPCHRVVAAQGLGGFGSAGLELKKRLLRHENITDQ